MKRCINCGRIPFYCECSTVKEQNEDEPRPLKKELIEPFATLEKKGIRPIIGFTQTQYNGYGKIEKRFYGGYHKIIDEKQEPYISVGNEFFSATDVMLAIIEELEKNKRKT